MCEAVICGLLKTKTFSPERIIISDACPERLEELKKLGVIIARSNQKAVDQANIIVLSVKPQNFAEVLQEVDFSKAELVVSIAAGVTLSYLEKKIADKPIIRVMPNNPALVQKGITAIAAGNRTKEEDIEKTSALFKSVGEVIEIKEELMDAVTGLSGSGPAFIYLAIEAMVEAGEMLGLTKSIAETLAVNTVLGSAETLLKTGKSAAELRQMVTSPGGTTKAGLTVLEEKGFHQALVDAIIAAAKRSKDLSQSA